MLFAGKYRLIREIGSGGMGAVHEAVHCQLDQRVAIKTLDPTIACLPEGIPRFLREARSAAKLRSEHVGRVIDVGALDSGEPFMVMEFLEGCDLDALIKSRGAQPAADVVDYVLQACEALAEAHAAGIVHRDIKPANLFLTQSVDGASLIKVLDFGISKAVESESVGRLTSTSVVIGTPSYMSPEQLRSSRDVDRRTDIWALGVVLFEGLTGRLPFDGEQFTEICLRVAMDPTPPMTTVALPAGLEAVVGWCLRKNPADRPQSVAELARALAPFTAAGQQRARRVVRVSSGEQKQSMPPIIVSHRRSTPLINTTLGSSVGESPYSEQVFERRTSFWSLTAGAIGTAALVAGLLFAFGRTGVEDHGAAGISVRPAAEPRLEPSSGPDAGLPDAAPMAVVPTLPASSRKVSVLKKSDEPRTLSRHDNKNADARKPRKPRKPRKKAEPEAKSESSDDVNTSVYEVRQ